MNIRRKRPADSLYMLLDTMCNAFGGIILLAVLVTLLSSKERAGSGGAASDTRELLQRRLALAKSNLQQSLRLQESFRRRANDARWKQQVALLSTRKELQDNLQQIRNANAEAGKELNNSTVADPTERLKFLNAQLAAAQARKLEAENSLAATTENTKRLKQRLESLRQQVAVIVEASQHEQRPPKEHETGRRPFYVIVQYGRIYPCRNPDLSRNETAISWKVGEESETAKPIQGRGYDPTGTRELQAFFNALPKDLVYIAFCAFEDSFPAFNRAKQIATSCGINYGWEPFRNEDGPVSFSSVGLRPKPQ
jgi:hypothetical protein